MMAISLDVDSQQKSTMDVCCTDALSVLQALTNNNFPHLSKALQLLSNNCQMAIQWIPPNTEFLEINKQTRLQSNLNKQSNQVQM